MFISKKTLEKKYVKREDYDAVVNSKNYFKIKPGDTVYYLVFRDLNNKFCLEIDACFTTIKETVVTEHNFFKLYKRLDSTVFTDYSDALDYVNVFYN